MRIISLLNGDAKFQDQYRAYYVAAVQSARERYAICDLGAILREQRHGSLTAAETNDLASLFFILSVRIQWKSNASFFVSVFANT